ncbi:MAG: hypothetical protein NMNS01_21660 [Nitrosomonas sp.]|nr:MAG: hypothetical protein NMNS01_21660 [Nitrosomonas sp.]
MSKEKKQSKKKLKKEANKRKEEEKLFATDENIERYIKRLSPEQREMVSRFNNECLEKGKKEKQYIKELTNEDEKELISELIDVSKGKIKVKAIGARDLSNLYQRKYFSLIGGKPEKPRKRVELTASSYSDSNNQPENPKPDNQPYEPDYDEPQEPIKIDERLLDELDKHSDEVNKYLDGI